MTHSKIKPHSQNSQNVIISICLKERQTSRCIMAAMVHAINNSKVVNKVDVNFQQLVYITYNISQLFNEKRKTSSKNNYSLRHPTKYELLPHRHVLLTPVFVLVL